MVAGCLAVVKCCTNRQSTKDELVIKRMRSSSTKKVPSKVVNELEIQTPNKERNLTMDDTMRVDMHRTNDGLNPKNNVEDHIDIFDVDEQMQVDPSKMLRKQMLIDQLNFHPMEVNSSDDGSMEV